MSPAGLRAIVLLSVLAALITIGLKTTAWALTGSVGLLSDALESGINLFAAVAAYLSLRYAHRPVDATHTYGHEKIEFFSSGLEGLLVIIAGIGTGMIAINRLIYPIELKDLDLGAALAIVASCVNLAVAFVLIRVGRRNGSIVLEADGQHLMADVWTSVAVVCGLVVVWATGVQFLDPIIAIIVGAHIIWIGLHLIRRSVDGLMDHALSPDEQERIRETIRAHAPPKSAFHALRTRQAGTRKFADFHLLVAGATTVSAAHQMGEKIEDALRSAIPGLEVTIHIEPIEEPASFEDNTLRDVEP